MAGLKIPLPVTDGRIIFNARQQMPAEIPGYTQDPDDPYQWHMDYCDCVHREIQQKFVCSTGRTRVRDWCHLKKIKVHPPVCKSCTETKIPQPQIAIDPLAGVGSELSFDSVGHVDLCKCQIAHFPYWPLEYKTDCPVHGKLIVQGPQLHGQP